MMYNSKLICVIKVNGKILREQGDVVYIPFGSEYEISMKNINNVGALVNISIDGEDVLDGSALILRPNNDYSLEGFMGGNKVSHKFKFIEKTQQISDYRGDRISDGIIRITYKFEKPVPVEFPTVYRSAPWVAQNNIYGSSTGSPPPNPNVTCSVDMGAVMDAGITVHGSDSNQTFKQASIGALESVENVIVFHLKGQTGQGAVLEPLLVKTKIRCDICGTNNTSRNKCCGNCGTSLKI